MKKQFEKIPKWIAAPIVAVFAVCTILSIGFYFKAIYDGIILLFDFFNSL